MDKAIQWTFGVLIQPSKVVVMDQAQGIRPKYEHTCTCKALLELYYTWTCRHGWMFQGCLVERYSWVLPLKKWLLVQRFRYVFKSYNYNIRQLIIDVIFLCVVCCPWWSQEGPSRCCLVDQRGWLWSGWRTGRVNKENVEWRCWFSWWQAAEILQCLPAEATVCCTNQITT